MIRQKFLYTHSMNVDQRQQLLVSQFIIYSVGSLLRFDAFKSAIKSVHCGKIYDEKDSSILGIVRFSDLQTQITE